MSSSTKSKFKCDWDEEELLIENLRITDSRVLKYLKEKDEENYEYLISRAIEIGIRVIREQKTIDKVDYVDNAFQDLTKSIEQQMDTLNETMELYFGNEGELMKITDTETGLPAKITECVLNDEKGIKAYLDPLNEDSPLNKLKRELLEDIERVKFLVVGEERASEIKEKTPLKGTDFEKELYRYFQQITKPFGDNLEHIGYKPSERGKKIGDLLIGVRDPLLDDVELLMVIEAKSGDYSSINDEKKLKDEIGMAIVNRESSFGIGVVRDKASLSESIGTFRFFEPNMIICCAEEPTAVELAYRFARSVVITRHLSQDFKEVDWENVKKFAQFVEQSLRKIDTARSDLDTLKTNISNINSILENYADNVRSSIKIMMQEIEIKNKEKK